MNSILLETIDDFDDLIATGDTLLLVFTGSFCGPSKVLQGVIDSFIREEEFPITLVEIDVEKFPTITRQYQVKATPQLVLLRDGEPLSSRLGTMSYKQLADYVAAELAAA